MMNKLEICQEEARMPNSIPSLFWFLTYDGKDVNYTVKDPQKYENLREGMMFFNDEHIILEKITPEILLFMQQTLEAINQEAFYNSFSDSSGQKENNRFTKIITYLEQAIKVATEFSDKTQDSSNKSI